MLKINRRDFAAAAGAMLLPGARGQTPPAAWLTPIESPVNQYRAEMLVLGPETGDDLNTLSLVAQLLDLGVAIELDDNWRLPTKPPRDLSAYKACLFPESARARYDKDLDAYYRGGGYLGYFKYYPNEVPSPPEMAGFFTTYGRDAYLYHVGNTMLESGLLVDHQDFRRTMQRRSVDSMIREYRARWYRLYEPTPRKWTRWGDTAHTQFLSNIALSERLGDRGWRDSINRSLVKAAETVPEALTGVYSETKALADTTYLGLVLMATLLFEQGEALKDRRLTQGAVTLMESFLKNAYVKNGVISSKYMRKWWSESLIPAPGLFWMARLNGDRKLYAAGDSLIRSVVAKNLRPDGIWYHWSNDRGEKGAAWSCGTFWSMLYLYQTLAALDGGDLAAQFVRKTLSRSLEGLRRYQDPKKGIWRLVIDEPQTRQESRGSSGIVYVYDQMKAKGLVDAKYADLAERAFLGLKPLYYREGLAASCRGTATGIESYYRTRPLGYYDMGLFGGALAPRSEKGRL